MHGLALRELFISGGRSLLAAIVMTAAILLWLALLPGATFLFHIPLAWIVAVTGAGIGILIYALASYLLGSPEIRHLAALARRRMQTHR